MSAMLVSRAENRSSLSRFLYLSLLFSPRALPRVLSSRFPRAVPLARVNQRLFLPSNLSYSAERAQKRHFAAKIELLKLDIRSKNLAQLPRLVTRPRIFV